MSYGEKVSQTLALLDAARALPVKKATIALRKTLAPLRTNRLPTVYYSGFKHGYIPHYIQKHKKEYPYFLKIDLQKFYPSMPHHDLIVEPQLGYKKLPGLQ